MPNTDYGSQYYGTGNRVSDMGKLTSMNTDVVPLYWDPILKNRFLRRNQLQSMIGRAGSVMKASSRKFNWGDYDDRTTYLKVVTNGTNQEITVSADDFAKLVINQKLWDKTNNKHYIITNKVSAGYTITLKWIDADSDELHATFPASGTWVADDELLLADNAVGEANSVSDSTKIATQKQVDDYYNYSQRLYRWVKTSKDKAAERWEFTNTTYLDHQRAVKVQELMDEVERGLWINKRAKFADSYGQNYIFNGFNNFDIQKGTGNYSDFEWANFIDFIETKTMKYYDGFEEELPCFVNNQMFTKVAEWASGTAELTLDFDGTKDKIGLRCHRLVTPHVDLMLYRNLQLNGMYSKTNEAIMNILDLNNISLMSYAGNGLDFGFNIETNLQKKTDDFILDRVSYTVGPKLVKENQASQLYLK